MKNKQPSIYDLIVETHIGLERQGKINRQKLYMVEGVTANDKIYLTDKDEKYEKSDSWTSGVYADFQLTEENVAYMKTFDAVASTFNCPNFKHTLDVRLNANFLPSMNFLEHAIPAKP